MSAINFRHYQYALQERLLQMLTGALIQSMSAGQMKDASRQPGNLQLNS